MSASRADTVYHWVKRAIRDGRLRPGDWLREKTLAERLRVSRTPVREALHRLETEGLLEAVPRQGLIVRDPPEQDLIELCVVRETLEGLAAGLAARSITQAELYQLEQLQAEMEQGARAGDVNRLVSLNNRFHATIWQASRNRYLAQQLHALRDVIFRLQSTTLGYPGRAEEMLREHGALLEALRAADADRAERVAREHMARAEAIRSLLRRQEAADQDLATPSPARGTGPVRR
jgi:DNA-binding GntR family transcriptional regulator